MAVESEYCLNPAVKMNIAADNILQFRFPDSRHVTIECPAPELAVELDRATASHGDAWKSKFSQMPAALESDIVSELFDTLRQVCVLIPKECQSNTIGRAIYMHEHLVTRAAKGSFVVPTFESVSITGDGILAEAVSEVMELMHILNRTVSFESGLITYLSEVPTQVSEAPVHIYIAEFQDPTVLCKMAVERLPPNSRQASGAGLDRDEALWSTLGEAVERYAASNWMHLELIEASADQVPGGAHFLSNAIYFSDADYEDPEFEFARPDLDKLRHWLKGRSLATGEPYHVPASCACMNFEAKYMHEILDRSYSTGLASHISFKAAIYTGLCEVVERDGYCSYWLSKTSPDVLSDDLVLNLIPERLSHELARLELNLRVFAMRTDVEVPIIVSCIRIEDGGIATGASCNLNLADAVTKAIVESMHTYNWCLDMKRLDTSVENKLEIDDFPDHVSYYLNRRKSDSYLWWVDAPNVIHEIPAEWVTDTSSPKEKLDLLVSQVVKAGFEPAWLDLTSPDTADIGFVVVKAFVAGLQPLSAGYLSPQTDPRRIAQFADYRGIDWGGRIEFDPPHAFP